MLKYECVLCIYIPHNNTRRVQVYMILLIQCPLGNDVNVSCKFNEGGNKAGTQHLLPSHESYKIAAFYNRVIPSLHPRRFPHTNGC